MSVPHVCGVVALLAPCALAGDVAIFVGPPGGTGNVKVFDEIGGAPPQSPAQLQGIRFVSLDFAARTALEELAPLRTRYVTDIPGASRVSLAENGGSLYHYARNAGAGGVVYGFMWIDAVGSARSVLELPAAATDADPFLPRIAPSPQGDAFLVATTLDAGGDLLEVELACGTVADHTSGIGPLDFDGAGLALAAQWGAAASSTGLLRFDRASTADAQEVPIDAQPPPVWFAREIVLSTNGSFAATIAGEGSILSYPFVFGAAGSAVRMSDAPAPVSGAGFLPEAENGPWLAVSDDGTACAWRVGFGHSYSRELFVSTAGVASPASAVHVTQDAVFESYLDEVGLFHFKPGRLHFAAGDPGISGQNPLRNVDLFQLTLPPPGTVPTVQNLAIRNLSMTSGDPLPPFLVYPALQPRRVAWSGESDAFLLYDDNGTQSSLLKIESDHAGTDEILDGIDSLDLMEHAGSNILLSVRSLSDPEEMGVQRLTASLSGDPDLLLPLASSSRFARGILGSDGSFGFITAQGTTELAWRLQPSTGEIRLLTQRPLVFGPTLALTSGGAMALSVGAPGAPAVFLLWPNAGPLRRLSTQAAGGFVLP